VTDLIPRPIQNIMEIHSLAEECAKNCDHKVQQPHTTTELQWMIFTVVPRILILSSLLFIQLNPPLD